MRKRSLGIPVFVALLVYILTAPNHSYSATHKSFTVTSLADTVDANTGNGECADAGGSCSLRAAIMEANALAGTNIINLPGKTFHLTRKGSGEDASETGDLDIIGSLIIEGSKNSSTVIDGLDLEDRLFDILSGARVEINNVTISNGDPPSKNGGGIRNHGGLTLIDSHISDSRTSGDGGGIYNSSKLTLLDSSVCKNYSHNKGGGIYHYKGSVEIFDSTICDNNSDTEGGGIYNRQGSFTAVDSVIRDNESRNEDGGGIYNDANAILNLSSTYISENEAGSDGGGIMNWGESNVVNSTINGNEADIEGGGINNRGVFSMTQSTANNNITDWGGGINNGNGKLTLTNSTISGNLARDSGGGIRFESGELEAYNATIVDNRANIDWAGGHNGGGIKLTSGSANLNNTIIALNVRIDINGFAINDDCSGTLEILSYSLLTTTTGCSFTGVSTTTGQNPKLGSLTDNGGLTQTHALFADSPAIDTGNPNGCKDHDGDLLTTDQRGYPRLFDGDDNASTICDIGAYEFIEYVPAGYLPIIFK